MNYSRPVVAPVQEIDWDQSESRKRDVLLRNANARGPPSPSPTQSSSSQRAPKSPRLHGSSPLSSPALPTHPGSRPVSPASSVGSFPPNSPISPLTPPAALALAGTQRVVSASSVYSDYSYYELPATPTGGSYPVSAPSPRTSHANAKPQSDALANPQTPQDFLQLGIKAHLENRLEASAQAFERSATLDGGCGVGMLMWGLAQRHGWGCVQDEARGFAWLRRAAELAVGDLEKEGKEGDMGAVRSELVLAIYEVGQSFFRGWGVQKDKEMAVQYYRVAARLGDPDAQQELGFCLLNGKGCKKDKKESAKWYRAAVKQGVSDIGLTWIYKEKYQ
ncbi:HCP-like protein [Epithele typhae]|uniref:HCP-like protein n=1 Tax=Epithele typhae TaxID=378194 RepID=UPI002008720D|nr:HCP-like protein [Epithele typhae]KAH9939005.1 HCP-like protein [Epithele typhae]